MLTAEELHDSIALATDRPGSFGGGRRRPVMNDEEPAGPTVTHGDADRGARAIG